MGDESPPRRILWPVLAGREHNVGANGVSACPDRLGRRASALIGMDTNLAEIPAKTRLKECPRARVKQLTGGMKHLVHDCGDVRACAPIQRSTLHTQSVSLAGRALRTG